MAHDSSGRRRQPTAADKPAGRGARSNPSGRFESHTVSALDDGWSAAVPEPLRAHKTSVTAEATRRIITRNDSPDVPFERSINPYKGCEHGCVYCFARPTHAYLGLSAGIDFESRIFSKPDAPELLRRELARPSYRPEVIALGANTDPYQPVERELGITRGLLEVFHEHRHPVAIVTKSSSILRDLDLLASMAESGLAHVLVSVTTLDRRLARRMEPRASAPDERLETIRSLVDRGVATGVLASPMIPGLNDAEAERILEAASVAGATSAAYILVRLPLEVKDLFEEWLQAHYPLKARHVLALVRDTRGGRLYQSRFGERMSGTGAYAQMLARRFENARRRLGLGERLPPLDTSQFRRPATDGSHARTQLAQLELFGPDDGNEDTCK